jgi:hypothetical protein
MRQQADSRKFAVTGGYALGAVAEVTGTSSGVATCASSSSHVMQVAQAGV